MCGAASLNLAIENYKYTRSEPNRYQAYREANKKKGNYKTAIAEFTKAARELHHAAGVPEGACGPAELKKFQAVLPDYQIKVFSATSSCELLFKGPEANRIIYLILDERLKHYNVITGPVAFYGLKYYCNTCEKPYRQRFEHSCKEKCPCCFEEHDRSEKSLYLVCKDCNRTFWNDECMAIHRKIVGKSKFSICQLIHKCRNR